MTTTQLACQALAARLATTDRAAHADFILSVAVDEATQMILDHKPAEARVRLARAERSAHRILGQETDRA